jgi:hypothetical protein
MYLLKPKKAAPPNTSTDVCTVSDFEYLIQIRAPPLGMLSLSLCMYVMLPILKLLLGMLNKEHTAPARPVSLSLYLCLKIKRASSASNMHQHRISIISSAASSNHSSSTGAASNHISSIKSPQRQQHHITSAAASNHIIIKSSA